MKVTDTNTDRSRSKAGFTLVEMLVSMIILLLATSVVVQNMPVVAKVLTTIVTESNADAMLSTAIHLLRNELDQSVDIVATSGNGIQYSTMRLDSSGRTMIIRKELAIKSGQVMLTYLKKDGDGYTNNGDPINLLQGSKLGRVKNLQIGYKNIEIGSGNNNTVVFKELAVYGVGDSDNPISKRDKVTIRVYTPQESGS